MRVYGPLREALPFLPILLFVTLLVGVPVAYLFATGVGSAGGASGVISYLTDPLSVRALENSLGQGAASAVVAVLLGLPLGILLGRYSWPGRSVAEAVALVPFLLPTLVVVEGVQGLLGPGGWVSRLLPASEVLGRGLPGIIVANAFFNVGLVALLVAIAVEAHSRGPLEDAVATLGGGPIRAFREVWGPATVRAAFAGGLLTLVFSALGFAAPLLLCGPRCYTLEVRVWELAQVLGEPGPAAVLAVAMVSLLTLPTAVYLILLQRLRSARERHGPRVPLRLSARGLWPLVAAGALVLLGIMAFLADIVVRSLAPSSPGGVPGSGFSVLFSAATTARFGQSTLGALGNTLFYATATVGIVLLLSVVTCFGARRSPRGARVVDIAVFVPLLVSPVVLAFGLATFWRPVAGGESSVWILILLSQATLALPFTIQGITVAASGIPPGFSEAARSLGSSPFQAYLETELPRLREAFRGAGVFAFALALGEFTATYFLATPGFATLPVELYALEGVRQTAAAAALGGLLVLVSLSALAALAWGGRRVVF